MLPRLLLTLLLLLPLAGCFRMMEALNAGATATEATAEGRAALVVENRTPGRLVAVHASSCSESSWGPNRLPYALDRNGTRTLDLEPGCYDLKARDENGREVERRGIQIGSGQAYTFSVAG